MKTLAAELNNFAVLNEVEMGKIFGGDSYPTSSSTTTEDEDIWM